MSKYRIEVEHIDKQAAPFSQTWWRLKSRNGRILATSETYQRLATCRRIAAKVAKDLGCKLVDRTVGA